MTVRAGNTAERRKDAAPGLPGGFSLMTSETSYDTVFGKMAVGQGLSAFASLALAA